MGRQTLGGLVLGGIYDLKRRLGCLASNKTTEEAYRSNRRGAVSSVAVRAMLRKPWMDLSRQCLLTHSARLASNRILMPIAELSSSGEVGEVFVEDPQGARTD